MVDVVRQVRPGLAVAKPLSTPPCGMPSLRDEGEEGTLLTQFYHQSHIPHELSRAEEQA